MGIWINYKKFEFSQPKEISFTDYSQIKGNYDDFIEKEIFREKMYFIENYKFKIFVGPIILIFTYLTWEHVLLIRDGFFLVVYLILTIVGIKYLGSLFSALSIYDIILNKKRFYKEMRKLSEMSTDYDDFQLKMKVWNRQQELGIVGRLTYKFLMKFR